MLHGPNLGFSMSCVCVLLCCCALEGAQCAVSCLVRVCVVVGVSVFNFLRGGVRFPSKVGV